MRGRSRPHRPHSSFCELGPGPSCCEPTVPTNKPFLLFKLTKTKGLVWQQILQTEFKDLQRLREKPTRRTKTGHNRRNAELVSDETELEAASQLRDCSRCRAHLSALYVTVLHHRLSQFVDAYSCV